MTSALALSGVDKHYGGVHAVRALTLEILDREVLTLIGPSGCGKSTLLRLVAGLERPDAGVVSIAGESVAGGAWVPPERRRVGLVFQDHALFPHLDVAHNVGFGLRDLSRAGRSARVRAMLDLVGLGHLAGRHPHELSGGEQQRVALARALAPRPAVVLLDEPFSSLDENLRARVRADTLAVLRETGSAAVIVTHDQTEALSLGDRIAVMRDGVVQQCATPEEIYERPANRFVASFMGSPPMNFVTGELADVDGKRSFRSSAITQHIRLYDALPDDPAVVLGVRPEDVSLSPEPLPGYRPGKVFVSEPLGPDVLVTVRIDGELIKARVPTPFRLGHDSTVHVGFNPDRLHLFAASDGAALQAPQPA